MKFGVMIVALFTLLSACATSPSGASRSPASVPLVNGTWVGTITGPDMATAIGLVEAPVQLTIKQDSSWTLTSSGGSVATGTVRHAGNSLVLEGTMTAGDPMSVGRAVSFVLKPRGADALYGDGETFFQGRRVDGGLALRRVT